MITQENKPEAYVINRQEYIVTLHFKTRRAKSVPEQYTARIGGDHQEREKEVS